MIVCRNQGCSEVLRHIDGVHVAGEPPLSRDDDGYFIRCPRCGTENRIGTPVRESGDAAD